MKTYKCVVIRQQRWFVTVEAESEEEAKDLADAETAGTTPNEDSGYDTTAREIETTKGES